MKRITPDFYRFSLYILVLLIIFPSCNTSKKMKPETTKIIYSYGDSSVPPPYHRSYTISVTNEKLHIVVDSYGDILHDKEYAMTNEKMENLIQVIEEANIRNANETTEADDCVGGTSRSITITSKEDTVVSGTNYYCGGKTYGNLKGDSDALIQALKAIIPDFNTLVE